MKTVILDNDDRIVIIFMNMIMNIMKTMILAKDDRIAITNMMMKTITNEFAFK